MQRDHVAAHLPGHGDRSVEHHHIAVHDAGDGRAAREHDDLANHRAARHRHVAGQHHLLRRVRGAGGLRERGGRPREDHDHDRDGEEATGHVGILTTRHRAPELPDLADGAACGGLVVGDRDAARRRDARRRCGLRARRHRDGRRDPRGGDPRGRVPPHVRGGRGPVRASAARRRRDARDQLERALPHRSRPLGAGRPRRRCRSAVPFRSRCRGRSPGGGRSTPPGACSPGPRRSRPRSASPRTASRSAAPSPAS